MKINRIGSTLFSTSVNIANHVWLAVVKTKNTGRRKPFPVKKSNDTEINQVKCVVLLIVFKKIRVPL